MPNNNESTNNPDEYTHLRDFLLESRNNATEETVANFAKKFNEMYGSNLGDEIAKNFFDKRNNDEANNGLNRLIAGFKNNQKATKESKKPNDTDEVDPGLKKEKTNEETFDDWEIVEKDNTNEITDKLNKLAISEDKKTKNRKPKKKEKPFKKLKRGFLNP